MLSPCVLNSAFGLFHTQRFEDGVFCAVIENQLERPNQISRNRCKIDGGCHRKKNFFCAAVQAYLQTVGQFINFHHCSTDTDFSQHHGGTEHRLGQRNGTQRNQCRQCKLFGQSDSLQILIIDDVVFCRGADVSANAVAVGFQETECCIGGLLCVTVRADAASLKFTIAGEHLAFQTEYANHPGSSS